tara:strand:- start:5831 stop:11113 length:5283 start_codon:yes stop_codon:yes gene_type:complete
MATTIVKHNFTDYTLDDFDETKNYHRILFRPGYAVQARELTQLQTSLQAQIDRHGQYAFKDGSRVVNGKVTLNVEYDFVKIESSFTHSSVGALNADNYLSEFVGTTITGATTGVTAEVIEVVAKGDASNPATLYVKYTNSGTNNITSVFANGEELTSNGSPVRYAKTLGTAATGLGSTVNIEEGVYFISGTFAYVPGGSLILDKYTNTPDYIIGLKVTESVVESGTDSTLLDNAQGVPNTAAPGAKRYKISTTLIKQPLALSSRTENDYITLIVIEDGKASADKTDKTGGTELTERMARRTFEESGDYVVEPFQINVREYLNTGSNFGFKTTAEIIADGDAANTAAATTFGDDRLVVGVDPSVAYVKGFRVQNNTTKNLVVEKPRSVQATNTVIGSTTSALIGNYIKLTASTVKGMPDVNTFATMNLHSAVGQGGSVIGTARARALEFVNNEVRVYLFDITMSGTNTFSSVKSVNQTGVAQNFIGNLASEGNLFEVGNNSMVFKLPQAAIKTLKTGTNTTQTTIIVKELFDVTSNSISVSAPTTLVNTGNITASLGTGVLDTSPNITINSPQQLTFTDISGATPSGSTRMKVMADVRKIIMQKQKTPVDGATKTGALSGGSLSLGRYDIREITEVKDASNVVITDRFTLDNGQRDSFYDNGKAILKPGFPAPTGNITVTFNHYTHTNDGDYFSVDSYPPAEQKKKQPFNSSKGTLNLLDCLDFRPSKAHDGANNFTGTQTSHSQPVKPNSAPFATVQHYMPRIDKVFITRKGEFKTEIGVPNLNPKAPETPDDAMGIYDLNLKPFVYDLDDVKPKILNNTRYTMKDIGALDKRIKNLEYYTSLSLLEQSAADVELFDGSGFSRLKNGFIVDGFRSHTVGDSANPDYTAAIDKANGILRPKFDERNVNLIRKSTESNSTAGAATLTKSLVTMPMASDVNYINQPYASTFSNVNPYNVFSWAGTMELSPESDEWKETDVRPNVVIDDSSSYEQFKQMAEETGILGTVWNEWETNWTGVETDEQTTGTGGFNTGLRPWWLGEDFDRGFGNFRGTFGNQSTTTTTTTTTQNQSRTGLNTELAFDTVLRSDGTRVVEVNFVPFIRSREIFFKAQLMKPSTKVHAFFDGVNVTDFCKETSFVEFATRTNVKTHEGEAAASASAHLITNGSGVVEGSFIIPRNAALKFQTGVREFRLTDDSTNNKENETTFAEAQYHAQGLIESVESRIVSTKVPRLVQSELNQDRTQVDTQVSETTEWIDPVAETILIDKAGGIFAKSVDLFFKTISTTIPVRVTIRTTLNGFPTQRIVPGADKIVYPTDIVSDPSTFANATAATATNFAFDYPVYLAQDTEYAIVITSQSDDYEVWIAEMGGFDVTNTSERITKQPYNGVFFSSANASTWTPEQSKDLKFRLNRASFSGSSSTLTLTNDILPPKKLGGNPLVTTQNSGVITVTHKNHGMYGGGTVTIAGAVDTNGIVAANINGNRTISSITHDSYTITAGSSDVSTNTSAGIGAGGGSAVTATENRHMDLIYPVISNISLPGTSIRYFLTTYQGKSINGNESINNAKAEREILVNKNFTFDSPSVISSAINESLISGNPRTFSLRCVLSTTDEAISPVIDLNRASVHTVENLISSNGGSETTATGGTELARYITKRVELNEEADSATVFLNVLRPGSSNVDLYYRTLEGGSSANISDVAFTAATPAESIPVNESSFSEVRYDLTESILTAANIGSFGTIQFKIVLRSTSTSNPPLIKDFRAICAT